MLKYLVIIFLSVLITSITFLVMVGLISMDTGDNDYLFCGFPIYKAQPKDCDCWYLAGSGDVKETSQGVGCNIKNIKGINIEFISQCKTVDSNSVLLTSP
jgi:hypothetical protein